MDALKLRHVCTGLISGATLSGKTQLLKRMIENRSELFDTEFDEVIIHYLEWQDAYDVLRDEHGVRFVPGPPQLEDYPKAGPRLMFLDDLMGNLTPDIINFFIRGAHHRSISCWILAQNLFYKGLRDIALNSHYVLLTKSPRSAAQIKYFCMQANTNEWRSLYESYLNATAKPYSYILYDFTVQTPDVYRVRTSIFPGETPVIYVPKSLYKKEHLDQQLSVSHHASP